MRAGLRWAIIFFNNIITCSHARVRVVREAGLKARLTLAASQDERGAEKLRIGYIGCGNIDKYRCFSTPPIPGLYSVLTVDVVQKSPYPSLATAALVREVRAPCAIDRLTPHLSGARGDEWTRLAGAWGESRGILEACGRHS